MIELLKNLMDNLGYIMLIAFIISRLKSFKNIILKEKFERVDLIILALIFGGFGILGTYIGTEINGAIANTRIIGVVCGGILCGPFVGIIAGIIAGIHRFVIDIGGITSVQCTIGTIAAGIVSGFLYKETTRKNKWFIGLGCGVVMESIEMVLILLFSRPYDEALHIVKIIYIPMVFTNGIGIAIDILLIQNIFDEKDEIAAKQAKIVLEVANKTLPYFREINEDSLIKVCEIIKTYSESDAVSITDREKVLSHVGLGGDHHYQGSKIITEATKRVINNGEILIINSPEEINCINKDCPLKSAIVAPIRDGEDIVGALKIYYARKDAITYRNENFIVGLSHIISTQLEISKVEKLKELADKAEIKALQAQINPHFLFNALNTITSFVRVDSAKARELIINLSTYLRYNIEAGEQMVDIYKELEQVKAYVDIEKARFGEKLQIVYKVEENLDINIPSLIIQPIVENAIKHGILEGEGKGVVTIRAYKYAKDSVQVVIEDDGKGIPVEIIEKVKSGTMEENKIGISNVNKRLIYIYGKGLYIEILEKGTRISFIMEREKG